MVIFALLDPDPDPADQNQCGSGSETLIKQLCLSVSTLERGSLSCCSLVPNNSLLCSPQLADRVPVQDAFLTDGRLKKESSSFPCNALNSASGPWVHNIFKLIALALFILGGQAVTGKYLYKLSSINEIGSTVTIFDFVVELRKVFVNIKSDS
jgi:hypothetical protein